VVGESFSERISKGRQNILREVAFVLVKAAQRKDAAMLRESRVQAMENFAKSRMFRAAAVVLCSAGLGLSAAVAQQETAPPPPPDQQQQGPPPNGQMQGPRHMDPERRVEMMQQRLNLNDSQTAQVRQIFTESHAQMETIRSNASLAPGDRRAQMMTLHQGEQARIRAVLTPDQQAKFDAMQARVRERHGDEGGQGAPVPPPPSGSPQA
jgi:Spy/CpxP family protein refolding chaperone